MKGHRYCLIALLLILGLLCTACAETEHHASAEAGNTFAILRNADALFQDGAYMQSLEQYLTAMEMDTKDMDARIGVVKCQIVLGNYDIAETNLVMAEKIDPSFVGICEMYLKMSQETDNIRYAQNAVALARKHGHDSFLENVPNEPVVDLASGRYSERMMLTITCDDPDAEIYVNIENSANRYCSLYNARYAGPITLLRGENTVSVYSMKNGMPSEVVTRTYYIDYDAVEVTFQEPLIEELTRISIGKMDGPITNYDCEMVVQLDWSDLRSIYDNYRTYQNLRIHSLEDLQHFPSLLFVNIQNQTEIVDYAPLRYCPMLYMLSLNQCGLTDTDFIKYVPNVSYLYIENNEISDFSGLENLKNLYSLSVYGNDEHSRIDSILRNQKQLEFLCMGDTQLEDFSILLDMENLTQLSIWGITYVDYETIGQLTNLHFLELVYDYNRGEYGNEIGDISFLPRMQNLQYLYLNGVNDVSDLAYIKQLPNLMTLYLYNCDVGNDAKAMNELEEALQSCSISY